MTRRTVGAGIAAHRRAARPLTVNTGNDGQFGSNERGAGDGTT